MRIRPNILLEDVGVFTSASDELCLRIKDTIRDGGALDISYKDPDTLQRSTITLYMTEPQLAQIEQTIAQWRQSRMDAAAGKDKQAQQEAA